MNTRSEVTRLDRTPTVLTLLALFLIGVLVLVS